MTQTNEYNLIAYWAGGSGNLSSDWIIGEVFDSDTGALVRIIFGTPEPSQGAYFVAKTTDIPAYLLPANLGLGGTLTGSMSSETVSFESGASYILDGTITNGFDDDTVQFGSTITIASPGSWTTGLLTVSGGATVDAGALTAVGLSTAGGSTLIVRNHGRLDALGAMGGQDYGFNVGGDLTIESDGSVTSGGTNGAGISQGSSVLVTGLGSTWVVTADLVITGELDISNFGSVTAGQLTVGESSSLSGTLSVASNGTLTTLGPFDNLGDLNPGSRGTVRVDGTGSLWDSAGAIGVGVYGDGTLIVSNHGSVHAVGEIDVAENEFSGSGDFTIESGGSVTSGGAYDTVGNDSKGTVTVTGPGSSWIVTASLVIGNYGTGELDISNYGSVNAGQFTVGQDGGSDGQVSITGSGTLTTTGTFDALGNGAGSSGGVTVDGTGSLWDSAGAVSVGVGGDGTLTVSNNASVSVLSPLDIGDNTGSSGTLDITSGGQVTSGGAYNVIGGNGTEAGSGTVTVDGDGSIWTTSAFLVVGRIGGGGLTIENDGSVVAGQFAVGSLDTGDGTVAVETGGGLSTGRTNIGGGVGSEGTVTVEGPGSVWDVSGTLTVGSLGDGELDIANGGTVIDSGLATIGNTAGSNGDLTILAGGTLEMTAAAQTTTNYFRIGLNGPTGGFAAAQGTVDVDGTGALLDAGANPLVIGGSSGGDGTLTIQDGGTVTASSANSSDLAALNFANFHNATASVTVMGTGSDLIGNGYVLVGRGGTAALAVENDATMQVNDAPLNGGGMGIGAGRGAGPNNSANFGGSGSATVTSGSLLDINSTVSGMTVGGNGDSGMLSVNDGGVVMTGFGMTVGTATEVNGTIYGGSGTLDIGADGTVEITDPTRTTGYGIVVGNANSDVGGATDAASGTVTVNGAGALLSTNGDAMAVGYLSNGTLNVGSGGTINAGSVTVGTTGIINLSGGTIDSTGITLGPGGEIIGSGTIFAPVINDSTIIASGGTLVIDGSINGNGIIDIEAGATLEIDGTLAHNSSPELDNFQGDGLLEINTLDSGDELEIGDGGTLEVDASGIGSSDTVTFNGAGILDITDPPPAPQTIYVNNYQIGAGNVIEFPENNLTIGYASYSGVVDPNKIAVYDGSNVTEYFIFNNSVNVATLDPVNEGSFTEIEIDPIVPILNPDPVLDYLGRDVSIDWSFIHKNEGNYYNPYQTTAGGLTVATGVDIGTGSFNNNALFTAEINSDGFPAYQSNNLTYLVSSGLIGLTDGNLADAIAHLPTAKDKIGNTVLTNISLDANQIAQLTFDSETQALKHLVQSYNNTTPVTPFGLIPKPAQTVMFDISYQMGQNGFRKSSLWPLFLKAAEDITSSGSANGVTSDWNALVTALNAYGGTDPKRRIIDATELKKIPGVTGSSSPQILYDTPIINTPSVVVSSYNYTDTVTSSQLALDPSGFITYTLTEDGGSPPIASIELPGGDADNYSVSYDRKGTWSTAQIAEPYQTINLPDGVAGLRVTLLDDNDNPVTGDTNYTFYITLGSTGTFSGEVASEEVACFLPGTVITTPTGEVLVERLSIGDKVLTAAGQVRPLVWIGRGRVMVTRGRRSAATPLIVRKDALADNVPHQDLHITKGHSLFFDGVLIPVGFLVNHRSIVWDDSAQEVTVYHLELDAHDVLLANGAPVESYRDDGNRWLFQNANSGWDLPPQEPCAPVLTGGPIVDSVWRRLLDRVGRQPRLPTTAEPDLHLSIDGRRVDAKARAGGTYIFRLPERPSSVRLISRAGAPDAIGIARDPRMLGVAVRQIRLWRGARLRLIEASDPSLDEGFHLFEADNGYRWTDGDALLPASLFDDVQGGFELELLVDGTTRYPLLDETPATAAA